MQVERVDVKLDQAIHLLNVLVQKQTSTNDRWPQPNRDIARINYPV